MFYDKDLMNSKSLGKIWRAGNCLSYDYDEEISMANVCEKLDSWVDNDHHEAHRRLALRTSAILLGGATRVYKRKMQQLFEDMEKLDTEMTLPKRSRHLTINDSDLTSTTKGSNCETGSESENMMSESTITSNYLSNANASTEIETSSGSLVLSDNQHTQGDPTVTLKADKEVQTCVEHSINEGNFDRNLPFGFVLIHDNYTSRIPSKIIVSSFHPDVAKLI